MPRQLHTAEGACFNALAVFILNINGHMENFVEEKDAVIRKSPLIDLLFFMHCAGKNTCLMSKAPIQHCGLNCGAVNVDEGLAGTPADLIYG